MRNGRRIVNVSDLQIANAVTSGKIDGAKN